MSTNTSIDVATETTLREIFELARRLWPESDYISIDGPGASWRPIAGTMIEHQWWLYVATNGKSLHQAWADDPASMLDALQKVSSPAIK